MCYKILNDKNTHPIAWKEILTQLNLRSGSICNNILSGKAKRKQNLIQTFYETSAAHFFD